MKAAQIEPPSLIPGGVGYVFSLNTQGLIMKGRKSDYAKGGKVRDLGGVKAPPYGENDKVLSIAKGKTTGIVGVSGIAADGVPAKSRTDKPGRKMGGMIKGKSKRRDDDDC